MLSSGCPTAYMMMTNRPPLTITELGPQYVCELQFTHCELGTRNQEVLYLFKLFTSTSSLAKVRRIDDSVNIRVSCTIGGNRLPLHMFY